jgi:hypothetical protein
LIGGFLGGNLWEFSIFAGRMFNLLAMISADAGNELGIQRDDSRSVPIFNLLRNSHCEATFTALYSFDGQRFSARRTSP